MVKIDYKEGKFSFSSDLNSFSDLENKWPLELFYSYLESNEAGTLEYSGLFYPVANYPFESPTQNSKGSLSWGEDQFDTEIIIRTTRLQSDRQMVQLLVEKDMEYVDHVLEKKIRFLIDGLINRID